MRGGNNRGGVKVTASSRRRRQRYTQDHLRDPWGLRRDGHTDEDGDDEADPAR